MEEINIENKQCSICGEIKPLSEFYKQKKYSKKRGNWIYYHPECKKCASERSYKWEKDNPDKRKKSLLKRRYTDEKIQELRINSKQRLANGKQLAWQRENKDKIREYNLKRKEQKTHKISDKEWEECKNYFNYRCAYCGLKIEEHYIKHSNKIILGDFHKEHVDSEGKNDLSNCIPSCESCNSKKWKYDFEDWYKNKSEVFDIDRYNKILKWLNEDYKKYIR